MAEIYHFGQYAWNIDKAQALIAVHPRKPQKIPVQSLLSTLGLVRINEKHAEAVDIKKPVILGWIFAEGQWFNILIDGNHRVFKANKLKKKTINAYILTKEENYHALECPAREQLNPEKEYIANYISQVTKKSPSRDDFYRQRLRDFLDSIDENNWKKEIENFSKIHNALIKREDEGEPDKALLLKLESLMRGKKCPGAVTIDWLLFGGQHPEPAHRIYINIDPSSFDPNNFCKFISWFNKTLSQVAYGKIPSSMFYKRLYLHHDSFIIYTPLTDQIEINQLVESCMTKLEELGIEFDREPSDFYIQTEGSLAVSFHAELAKLAVDTLKSLGDKASSFEEFFEEAIKAFDVEGLFTKKLVEKNLIL